MNEEMQQIEQTPSKKPGRLKVALASLFAAAGIGLVAKAIDDNFFEGRGQRAVKSALPLVDDPELKDILRKEGVEKIMELEVIKNAIAQSSGRNDVPQAIIEQTVRANLTSMIKVAEKNIHIAPHPTSETYSAISVGEKLLANITMQPQHFDAFSKELLNEEYFRTAYEGSFMKPALEVFGINTPLGEATHRQLIDNFKIAKPQNVQQLEQHEGDLKDKAGMNPVEFGLAQYRDRANSRTL